MSSLESLSVLHQYKDQDMQIRTTIQQCAAPKQKVCDWIICYSDQLRKLVAAMLPLERRAKGRTNGNLKNWGLSKQDIFLFHKLEIKTTDMNRWWRPSSAAVPRLIVLTNSTDDQHSYQRHQRCHSEDCKKTLLELSTEKEKQNLSSLIHMQNVRITKYTDDILTKKKKKIRFIHV